MLKPVKQSSGYLTATLHKNGTSKVLTRHRLVAKAFIPNPENKPCVNHKDFDRHNNNSKNLEWVTYSENIQHSKNNGGGCGELNGNSKLTKEQVLEMRAKYKFREYTYEMLSKEYGVMKHYVGRIINRKVWKSI